MSMRVELSIPGLLEARLDIPDLGLTAVIGPSGAGKTLLLRALAGLEQAQGVVEVGGRIWQDATVRLPAHRRRTGFVFQHPSLLPHLSVRGNLEFAAKRQSPGRRLGVAEVANRLGLAALMDRRPDRLSGGESQRVALARALLASPEILLLDEPVSALDPGSRGQVLQQVSAIKAGLQVPVLYVTHDIDEVARLADHLALLEGGRITASGPLSDMLTRLDLPLARSEEAESVLRGRVRSYDRDDRLALVETAGGDILAASDGIPDGREVRLRIKARDVSLTTQRQEGTSILNILPAAVREVWRDEASRVVVLLDAGGLPLLAHISRRSAQALDVHPGRAVFAQVKSVAVLS